MEEHQIIIIGGGPAGLTAGIYAARDRRDTLLIEKSVVGGMIALTEKVDNFPGFPEGISGMDLGIMIHKQAEKFGLKTLFSEVKSIGFNNTEKIVRTPDGDFKTKALIIAGGSEMTKLGIPGEVEFTGRGVSYCATCDGAFFADVPVAVVGGGNVAISDAVALTRFASKIYVVHRRDQLRADKILQEAAFAEPKIEFVLSYIPDSVEGKDTVTGLKLHSAKTQEPKKLDVSGVFVAVGYKPNTDYLKGIISLDEGGYIQVNAQMETSVPGVFAAGDIRSGTVRQTVAAAGDGAVAAISAGKYLENMK